MSRNTAEWINSVCTNYQELLVSDDFLRVIKISLKSTDFRQDAILKYFQVLREWNWLTDREKANLKSFLENGNVRKAVVWLLNKFSQSPLPSTQNIDQSEQYNKFLRELFWEDGFEKARAEIAEIAGIDGIKWEVTETLNYTSEVQARRKAWSELATELWVDENRVNVTNAGINIDWVANFELNDSQDMRYIDLEKDADWVVIDTTIPKQDIWIKFVKFMSNWSRTLQETFLVKVMGMNTIKKWDWNFYLSASSRGTGSVHGLGIGWGVVVTYWLSRDDPYSVRRVQN